MDNAALIQSIARDEIGLTIGRCDPVADQIHLIYVDEKRSKPRSPGTLIALFYDALSKRGISAGIGSSQRFDSEFPTLIFTRMREVTP